MFDAFGPSTREVARFSITNSVSPSQTFLQVPQPFDRGAKALSLWQDWIIDRQFFEQESPGEGLLGSSTRILSFRCRDKGKDIFPSFTLHDKR